MKLTKETKTLLMSKLTFDIIDDEHPTLGIIPNAFYEDFYESIFVQDYRSNYYTRANYERALGLLGFCKGVSAITSLNSKTMHHEHYIAIDLESISEKTGKMILGIIDQIENTEHNCLDLALARRTLGVVLVNYLENNHYYVDLENEKNFSKMLDFLISVGECSLESMEINLSMEHGEILEKKFGAILQ